MFTVTRAYTRRYRMLPGDDAIITTSEVLGSFASPRLALSFVGSISGTVGWDFIGWNDKPLTIVVGNYSYTVAAV